MSMAPRPLRPGRVAPPPLPSEADGDQVLFPLADQIRTAYIYAFRAHWLAKHGVPSNFGIKKVPRYDGGQGPDGKTYKPIWYKIARAALHYEISPDDLIRAIFQSWDRKDPPWPTNMLNPKVLAWAATNRGISAEDTMRALRVQREIWEIQIFLHRDNTCCDFVTAARATLRNRRLDLSSIFRYCMAIEGDDPETAQLFEDGAAIQYVYNRRAYDSGWGDLIPGQLKAIADRLQLA
jgi:hypothetical protein